MEVEFECHAENIYTGGKWHTHARQLMWPRGMPQCLATLQLLAAQRALGSGLSVKEGRRSTRRLPIF